MSRICTRSGILVNLRDLRPEDINLEDICHSLANLCRFTGHTEEFYSVAQHSLLTSRLAQDDKGYLWEGETILKACLAHDFAEAYLGDVSTPLKSCLPDLRDIEERVEAVIFRKLELPPLSNRIWKQVKYYDIIAVNLEAAALIPKQTWAMPIDPRYQFDTTILTPRQAEKALLQAARSHFPHMG